MTAYSRTTSIRYTWRQGGTIPMDAAMPDTTCIAAGRELQAFFGIATRRQRPASRLRTRRRSLHGRHRPPITPARRTTTDDASSIEARISHNVRPLGRRVSDVPSRPWLASHCPLINVAFFVWSTTVTMKSAPGGVGGFIWKNTVHVPSGFANW